MNQVLDNKRTARVDVRITPTLQKAVKRAAEIQGRTVSDFVVDAIRTAANKAVSDMEIVTLTLDAQERFFEAIMNPPEPNESLKRAIRASRKLDKRHA